MSSKEIKISPELFDRKKNKTLKKPTGKQLKKELLQRLSQGSDLIQELDALTKEKEPETLIDTREITENVTKEEQKEPTFGCLKNGYKLPSIAQIRKIAKTQKLTGKFWTNKGVNKIFIYDADTDEAYSSYALGDEAFQQIVLVEDKKKKVA
jgi:hypothetical protein